MIDLSTNRPLRVSLAGKSASYVIVPVTQLPVVQDVLDSNHIRYHVGSPEISINNEPFVAFVHLRKGTDPKNVQDLLDGLVS